MGRTSCRKQGKQQSPQPSVATPLPPLPPGSPPSREIWDWRVHPEGNFAHDLPCVISTLWMRDGERWGDWAQQHNPVSVRDLTMVVLGYLAADMGGMPSIEQEGEEQSLPSPVPEREEQGSPQSPPPAGEGRLLLPLPQPQLQQRPEEPENLFPWCTWCGEVDHRWRDCSEVPPSWCGRCEEGGHDWSGCPYASSPVPEREEPEHPQPKEEEVGASIVLGPKPPAEEECLLSPCPPAEGKCLLVPPPPAEDECLLVTLPHPAEDECLLVTLPQPAEDECLLVTLPQPAEDECLLVTLPQPAEDECLLVTLPQPAEDECLLVTLPQPAEDECLLVSLPPPALTPAREGDKPQSPARKAEPHQSPAREAEQDQSPAKGGDYTLLPPSSPGDHMLLPPPLLPPQEPEGEELQAPPPENFWGGEGQDAGVPQQPLFMLLKAARRAPAQPPQRREPAPPGAEELELPLPPVPPPQGGRWPEPQKGELPATKKGEEVWRPLSPAAVSLQEFLWPEPHKGELPAMKKGEVGGPPAPAAFSLQDGTSMLSAVPLPAGVLTAWPAMGPLKPPFPARDYVLDCWIFKGGGGR
ncbi:UNVERIFIED_CONTAM: hypothetical protein FKN15_004351 [Acipenser sinensis]